MLLLTDRADDFREQWSRPASPYYKPTIHPVSEGARGDTVVALILFTGCTPSSLGECHLDVDYRVLRPDGSVYAEPQRAIPLWNDPPPPTHSLQLGANDLGLQIEPTDPLGRYEIHAEVHDRVAHRNVSLVQVLTVVEAARPSDTPSASKQTLRGGLVSVYIPATWRKQGDDRKGDADVLAYEVPLPATDRTPHLAQLVVRSFVKQERGDVAELAYRALRPDLERPGFAVLATSVDATSWLTILSTGGDHGARYAVIDRFAASSDLFVQMRLAFPLLADAPSSWYDEHVSEFNGVLASLTLHAHRARASQLRLDHGMLTLAPIHSQEGLVAVGHPALKPRFPEGPQGLVLYAESPPASASAR